MDRLFENISCMLASGQSRRRVLLKLIGSTLASVLLSSLLSMGIRETHAEGNSTFCCLIPRDAGVICSDAPRTDENVFRCVFPPPEGLGGQAAEGSCSDNPRCQPTVIELRSFTAEAQVEGTVALVWETATEVDNAGFNLYRATTEGGPYTKINGALIPAKGSPVAGASYKYVDSPGPGTFRYILTDVDSSGETTLHGPVPKDIKIPMTPTAR